MCKMTIDSSSCTRGSGLKSSICSFWASKILLFLLISWITCRFTSSLIRGTEADSIISQRLMNPSDFLSSRWKYSFRISPMWMFISPPSFSPVTARSTSLESTARKLACEPYCLTPTGMVSPCYLSPRLGSNTSLTRLSIISMTASLSFLTESNFHSKVRTVCLTYTETISWNFSSSSHAAASGCSIACWAEDFEAVLA